MSGKSPSMFVSGDEEGSSSSRCESQAETLEESLALRASTTLDDPVTTLRSADASVGGCGDACDRLASGTCG